MLDEELRLTDDDELRLLDEELRLTDELRVLLGLSYDDLEVVRELPPVAVPRLTEEEPVLRRIT